MELQSPPMSSVRAKRLWKVLKIVLSVIRKGVITKAIKLAVKTDHAELLRKSLMGNSFMSRSNVRVGSFGVSEYEFSCTNSPNPVLFRSPNKKKQLHFLSCFRSAKEAAWDEPFGYYYPDKVAPTKTPEYLFNFHLDQAPTWYDRHGSSLLLSPCAVRVSDCLSVDDEDDGSDGQVDSDAEEFIRKFHEQLLLKSPISLKC